MTAEVKRAFTREEAATYTGLSIYKIKTAIRDNELPAKRRGKDVLVLREDLDSLIDAMEVV